MSIWSPQRGGGPVQNSQGSSLAAEGGGEYSESVPHARKVARAVLAPPENPTRLAYRFPSPIHPPIYHLLILKI